ncbi:MAG: hypothetical protein AUG51_26095 [Acidobacteria bacterium 13_1_20CM_3_53_8]|nr:MAG: hypothetical protein AUG51_26095 [Acidobacteria bacterium 13_1_20CM_3_53_8]
MAIRQQERVRAPELTGGRGWLNTDRPLTLAGLKGKVVLLDFWTYGCINCMHIIPDLKKLERKYANQLVVIGVHSAKFANERETENIRRIILRYEIEHPVINDADFKIWNAYAVRAWPTQWLIDPAGYLIGRAEGEGNYEALDQLIGKTVEEFRRRGELNEQPLRLALERARVGDLPLAFPGKILADARGDRLFIADSNHNRIVVTKLDGTLLETIGTGERGAQDGSFDHAQFYRPQGMALDGDMLYVADTENHLIRRVDLKTRTVQTIAGTGRQGLEPQEAIGQPATSIALNSPWDLQLIGRNLYIAMAGPHQIWRYDIALREVAPFAGTGQEARQDGDLTSAAFAQPSGLASDGKTLYVSDAEANIIRAINLEPGNRNVVTLVGGDLFDFGDVDGVGDDVRLQHPLGIVTYEGKLFIADTYNHKIKELDTQSRTVRTFAGTGKPGQEDGAQSAFYEPGGLSVANGKLYVADTNNHAVRVVDLKTKQTSTLVIKGLRPPATNAQVEAQDSNQLAPNAEEIKLQPQRLHAQTDATLQIEVALPTGYHVNTLAPNRYQISIESGAQSLSTASGQKTLTQIEQNLSLPLRLPLRSLAPGKSELRVALTIFYCREDNTGTCLIKTLVWRVPVEVTTDASATREVRVQSTIR